MEVFEPYLCFNGNCREAVAFYQSTLGASLEMMMTWAEAPMDDEMCKAGGDNIMHASLTLGGRRLMASDSPPGMPFSGMHGFGVSLSYDIADEGRRIFAALAEGGQVTMPIDRTFWAEAFGMVTDRFGTPWMVSGGPIPMG